MTADDYDDGDDDADDDDDGDDGGDEDGDDDGWQGDSRMLLKCRAPTCSSFLMWYTNMCHQHVKSAVGEGLHFIASQTSVKAALMKAALLFKASRRASTISVV